MPRQTIDVNGGKVAVIAPPDTPLRVATLVASGAPSDELFATVAEEVARVMHVPMVGVCRYDGDRETMTVAASSCRLYGPRRHCDCECREPRETNPARRGASGVAPGGDACR
jgi:hypothetical protein